MKSVISRNFKKHYLFFLLIPIVIISQAYLLAPDSKFGLIDVDTGTLYDFRQLRETYPDNLQFLINSYKRWGTYFHQLYYLGFLNYLFGTNFEDYHIFAHIFKVIATIGIYPLFYFLSGSSLVAFLSAIFYSFSPSSMGSLYGLSNGNDYPAISLLTIFLLVYLHSVKNNISSLKWLVCMLIFFLGSIIISPERSLPIIIVVLILEAIWVLRRYSKHRLLASIRRAGFLLSPILLFLVLKPPSDAIGSMTTLRVNIENLLTRIMTGRSDYLLNPFISLSSTFLPDKYLTLIGMVQTDNFIGYMTNLLTVPIITIFIPTLFIAALLSKKPLRFTLLVFLITIFGGIFSYFSAFEHPGVLINQSIAGFYILGLTAGFLMEYLESKNNLYFGLFFGPFISFIFILVMWLGSGDMDTFRGIYRYLTIASIFSCFFLGSIIVLLYKRIYQKNMFFKLLSLLPFLLLIQILWSNVSMIKDYYAHSFAIGYGYEDQNQMRQLLFPFYQNLSLDNPRLIYVDTHSDPINTQFYANTVYAGANAWPMFWPSVGFKQGIIPQIIIDYPTLASWVTRRDGKAGIFDSGVYQSHKPTFYKPENFYAVRFVNKKLIDITNEIKEELKLSD